MIVETGCQPQLSPKVSAAKIPIMMEKEAGGGRPGATQVNHQKVKWQGLFAQSELAASSPSPWF